MPKTLFNSVLLVFALFATACSGAHFTCDPSQIHPPRNFSSVPSSAKTAVKAYRGAQPTSCGELEYLQDIGVRSILKLNDRGLKVDAAEQAEATSLGLRIESFPFNAATIGNPSSCQAVRNALNFLAYPGNWPVYVHCTAGKDRTGYIVGMFERYILAAPASVVMADLHEHGHRGVRSLLMPHIDRELASETPNCAPVR